MTTGLLKKLIAGDRAALAFAITLVETQSKSKRALATELVQEATKVSTRSTCLRIAMTGAPGAGKSCLLERVGMELIKRGKKVAVLAIDPSSPTTKGSLLGDKTRMTELSRQLNAFVRPSPTNGWLGGVTRATGEATLFCELAGYDVIFVETVGVGQSEAAVSHVTDCCTMVLSPNAGDELQAMKRGVMELCDFFLVNKCDGDLVPSANRLKSELLSASKFMAKRRGHWSPVVKCVSANSGLNVSEYLDEMLDFHKNELDSGRLHHLRRQQKLEALRQILKENILEHFRSQSREVCEQVQSEILSDRMSVSGAAQIVLDDYYSKLTVERTEGFV
ncbi:methylmalonic aciduria type A protein, mitochondrial-like isoform X3 [Convolutriloba macropyga]|uniref:methylmalonic aciduria type A protein, mitochondrial-like isoform X3 n=1 Tax=Convolutriloba macropyga TaxID=536237 RepID=UPI003F523E72